MTALRNGTAIEVVRHNVAGKSFRVREVLETRRYGNRLQVTSPEIGQVTVLVPKLAEALPADADVERQPLVNGPVVLEKGALVT